MKNIKAVWVGQMVIVVDEDEFKSALVIFGSACVPIFDPDFDDMKGGQ